MRLKTKRYLWLHQPDSNLLGGKKRKKEKKKRAEGGKAEKLQHLRLSQEHMIHTCSLETETEEAKLSTGNSVVRP